MYFNTQEEIITRIGKSLEKSLILRKKVIKILSGIIIGIILGKSTIVSRIAENLKEDFCNGTEESKKKKIKRFFNRKITDDMYQFFVEDILTRYKAEDNKVLIVFDHTTCDDRFVILNFMLSIGKRGVPLYYKIYEYKDPKNKNMEDVKKAINNYKRRFTIEEMFKDMKSNGLGMEETWSKKLEYFKNIMLCISIAYVYIITIGSECCRNGRNKEIGVHVKTKRGNKTRVYSVFTVGMKWFKRCYFSKKEKRLICEFLLYDL